MKKLLLMLFLAASITSQAQTYSIGAKGGVNISNFTGGGDIFADVKKKAKIGYYIGGFIDFWVGSNLAIQPEVLLSTQGARIEAEGETRNLSITYINVPIVGKFKSDGGFYFEAGPQVGFKISESTPDESLDKFAKGLDLSVVAGLGFQSSAGIGFGARYIVGLSKVGSADLDNPDFKNSVIQVGLSFTIGNPSKKK
ncbi:MAG: porin family protein [Ferruginibacter sp.]